MTDPDGYIKKKKAVEMWLWLGLVAIILLLAMAALMLQKRYNELAMLYNDCIDTCIAFR